MKITNRHNLPEAIYSAVSQVRVPIPGTYSVTELIKPARMVYLIRKHWDDIEIDASERLWAILGTAVHTVLEKHAPDNAFIEETLGMVVDGIAVTGRPDLWREPANLEDYKVTSVYSFLLGEKAEWEQQQNLYAVLYREHGFPVWAATIRAILRDWQGNRVKEDYPPSPFISKGLPVWPPAEAKAFLYNRVNAHIRGSEGLYPPCSPEERWARPDQWAVKKRGNKQALRLPGRKSVLDTPEAAEELAASLDYKTEIEFRLGSSIRCERYCDARAFCPQWAMLQTQGVTQEEPD